MNRLFNTLILCCLAVFPMIGYAQSIEELFVNVPKDDVTVAKGNRKDLIAESKGNFLKLKLNDETTGEFKILSKKKDEFLVGVIWKDCGQSNITFWQIRKGIWKDVTQNMIDSLGEKDVLNILAASPATVEDLSQKVEISYFYTFENASSDLQLIARKQGNCEIAGKVYDYKFNGKRFNIIK